MPLPREWPVCTGTAFAELVTDFAVGKPGTVCPWTSSGMVSRLPLTPTVVVWLPFGRPVLQPIIDGFVDEPADPDRGVGAGDQKRAREAAADHRRAGRRGQCRRRRGRWCRAWHPRAIPALGPAPAGRSAAGAAAGWRADRPARQRARPKDPSAAPTAVVAPPIAATLRKFRFLVIAPPGKSKVALGRTTKPVRVSRHDIDGSELRSSATLPPKWWFSSQRGENSTCRCKMMKIPDHKNSDVTHRSGMTRKNAAGLGYPLARERSEFAADPRPGSDVPPWCGARSVFAICSNEGRAAEPGGAT